ncbi:MAG: FUSC family protein [Solirubrobacteraceae bacterium]
MVPLAIGWWTGHIDLGAFAALGALPAGMASFQGVTRSRVSAVAAASIGMAVSTFVGATLANGAPWVLVAVVVVWGYGTGLAVCLGKRLSVAALQWAVALLISIGLPLAPGAAVGRAALVLAGGLFQGVLVAGSWAVRAGHRERVPLAASYRALEGYAAAVAADRLVAPPPVAFPAVGALQDPNPLLPEPARLILVDLLEEAERVRGSIAALAAAAAADPETAPGLRRIAAETAGLLGQVATALSAGRHDRGAIVDAIAERAVSMRVSGDFPWRWTVEALFGQLRAVADDLRELEDVASVAVAPFGGSSRSSRSRRGVGAIWPTLRANMTLSTEAGRHAVRLAVIAGLAEVMVQATKLEEGRWAVLTIFLVLKPDYSTTVYRGVQRAIGTAFGAGLGAALVQLGHLGHGGLVIAAGAAVSAAYALFDVSYLLFSVCLTTFIVVLLEILGMPAVPTAWARLIDTAIGSGLALLGYFAWPTWEGTAAQEKFARLLEVHRDYSTAVLEALADPKDADPDRLRELQAAARRARGGAEASVARLSDEPARPPLTPELATSVMAPVTRLAQAELALHALVWTPHPSGNGGGPPDVRRPLNEFAGAVGEMATGLAEALRSLSRPGPIPALRPLHSNLREEVGSRDVGLITATDGIVDALDTIHAVLEDRLPAGGQPAAH